MEEKNRLEKLLRKIENIPAKEWNITSTSCTNQYKTTLNGFKICMDTDGWVSVDSIKWYQMAHYGDKYKERINETISKVESKYKVYTDAQNKIKEETKKREEIQNQSEYEIEKERFENFLDNKI